MTLFHQIYSICTGGYAIICLAAGIYYENVTLRLYAKGASKEETQKAEEKFRAYGIRALIFFRSCPFPVCFTLSDRVK